MLRRVLVFLLSLQIALAPMAQAARGPFIDEQSERGIAAGATCQAALDAELEEIEVLWGEDRAEAIELLICVEN